MGLKKAASKRPKSAKSPKKAAPKAAKPAATKKGDKKKKAKNTTTNPVVDGVVRTAEPHSDGSDEPSLHGC
ncbi:hypothetical protein GOP47_0002429 [Adiantum capillus-veneris]|uniref:Uncharacterized protein n=1 Tax=Adiantum capillus-veneris TaxID=13818 RepID=A0A9D4VBK3_ADICA|nr:hypothetical protein GOP47_0002429 [Adiantum capillus-veneris]